MAETYHEDILLHLRGEQNAVNARINSVHEIINNGGNLKDDVLASTLASVKESGCAICADYNGNDNPDKPIAR